MINRRDEGLGLSVLVYAGIMVTALALLVTPVVWASGPTEYPNPELPKYDITSSRTRSVLAGVVLIAASIVALTISSRLRRASGICFC